MSERSLREIIAKTRDIFQKTQEISPKSLEIFQKTQEIPQKTQPKIEKLKKSPTRVGLGCRKMSKKKPEETHHAGFFLNTLLVITRN